MACFPRFLVVLLFGALLLASVPAAALSNTTFTNILTATATFSGMPGTIGFGGKNSLAIVAVNSDADILVGDPAANFYSGAVVLFPCPNQNGATCTVTGNALTLGTSIEGNVLGSGQGLGMSSCGSIALFGTPYGGSKHSGALGVYKCLSTTTCVNNGNPNLASSATTGIGFGTVTACDGTGTDTVVLVGQPADSSALAFFCIAGASAGSGPSCDIETTSARLSPNSSSLFGTAIAAAGGLGTFFAIGSPGDNSGVGSVYMFNCSGGSLSDSPTCVQGATLIAPDGAAGDQFGVAVAASVWTSTSATAPFLVAVGAAGKNSNNGGVYMFQCTDWSSCSFLSAIPAASTGAIAFGSALALQPPVLAVGAPSYGGQGAVMMYDCTDPTNCNAISAVSAPPSVHYGQCGASIAVLHNVLAIGCPNNNGNYANGDVGVVLTGPFCESANGAYSSQTCTIANCAADSTGDANSGYAVYATAPVNAIQTGVCATGYQFNGLAPQRQCLLNSTTGVSSFGPVISGSSCVPQSCAADTTGTAGEATFAPIQWGQTQTGVCITGYRSSPTNGLPTRTCTLDVQASTPVYWGTVIGSCVTLFCPTDNTGSPDLGYATFASTLINQAQQGVCISGYEASSSPPLRSCFLQASDNTAYWGPVTGNCTLVTCPALVGDAVLGTASFLAGTAPNTVASGTCPLGWDGTASMLCGAGGIWDNATSVNSCVHSTCPSIDADHSQGIAAFGSVFVNTNNVVAPCPSGWIGTSTRNCSLSGIWTPALGACTQIFCDGYNTTSTLWPTSPSSAAIVQGQCAFGYSGNPSRVCSDNGVNGTWLSESNPCRLLSCTITGEFANATWPVTPAGAVATGNCSSGFYGSPSRTCQANGDWSTIVAAACSQCAGVNCAVCADGGASSCNDCLRGYVLYNGLCTAEQVPIDYIPFVISAGFIVLVGVVYLILRWRSPTSQNMRIVTLAFAAYDLGVDIVFTISLVSSPIPGVFIASIVLLGAPTLINLIVMIFVVRGELQRSRDFVTWLKQHATVAAGIFTVSGKNIEVLLTLQSQILKLRFFSAPMSEGLVDRIQILGFVSTLVEGVPQLALQLFIAITLNSWPTPLVLSLISSILTILFGIVRRTLLLLIFVASSKHADKGDQVDSTSMQMREAAE